MSDGIEEVRRILDTPENVALPGNVRSIKDARQRRRLRSEELRSAIRYAGDIEPSTEVHYLVKGWHRRRDGGCDRRSRSPHSRRLRHAAFGRRLLDLERALTMPRPTLPNARDIASIAKALRAEGFTSVAVETAPDGTVRISAGQGAAGPLTPLEAWRATRGAS